MTFLCLVVTLLMIASCGGGGGGSSTTTSSHNPVITNFQIRPLTPEKANTEVRYSIIATVADPDNDLFGGRVELNDGAKTLTTPLDNTSLSGNTVSVILVTNPVPPGSYRGTFAVVDAAGNRSKRDYIRSY